MPPAPVLPKDPAPSSSFFLKNKKKLIKGAVRDNIPNTSLFALKAYNTTVTNQPLPSDITRSDVRVEVKVSLERPQDKTNEQCIELASHIQETVQNKLNAHYTGSAETARLLLKVYVVLASLGKVGQHAAKECLEWFLESADGSTIYRAGRVGDTKKIYLIRSKKYYLTKQLPKRLVQEIVSQVDIE